MILLKVIGEMLKTLLEIWKDRSGGIDFGLVSGILSVVSSVAGLFGGKEKKQSAPTVLAPPEGETGQVREAQDRARRRRASTVGRQGTILTSPLGLTTGDDSVARPSLLGQ